MKSAVILVACLSSGCGLTFGVEVVDRVIEVDTDATGVTSLEILDLGVKDEVSVCGGGERLVAAIQTTEWSDDAGASPDQLVEASFDIEGDRAAFRVGGGDETIVLNGVTISAPPSLSTNITVSSGNLTVCDFSGALTASVGDGRLALQDIAAPIEAVADSVSVDFSLPIDLTTNGAVTGDLSAGGRILTSGSAILGVSAQGFDRLDLEGADATILSVRLPIDGSWTIRIKSEFGAGRVIVGDVDYDSTLEDAEPVANGLEFEIRGGGPIISLVATSADVQVWDALP